MSLVGETLGNYKIEEMIGHGSMAEVYRAVHKDEGYPVAIKVVHSHLMTDKTYFGRFEREAKVLTQLEHSHIVYVYEYQISSGLAYLVMEYLSRGTLEDKLMAFTDHGLQFPIVDALKIMEPVASAVDYAHEHGMVHRDLKPANILFRDNGDPVLTDFGLAFLMDHPRLSASNTITGTPAYLSPEQAKGQPGDPRSDIYAMGIMLYELLAGVPPFQGNVISVVMKHISETPSSLRSHGCVLPKPVEDVIMKALEKEPRQRYQSAQVMLRMLREAIEKYMPDELPTEAVEYNDDLLNEPEAEVSGQAETGEEISSGDIIQDEGGTPENQSSATQSGTQAKPALAEPAKEPLRRRVGPSLGPLGRSISRPITVFREQAGINWITILAVVGVLAVVLACFTVITVYIQNNDVSEAGTPKFGPGQRALVAVPGNASTSVYNGCPPFGVRGLASNGQIAKVIGRRTCGKEWYYEVSIPEAVSDDWDGTGTIQEKFLK